MSRERVHTIVIGGGQAGLAVGYHLTRLGIAHLILDAHGRVGDAWRRRWNSLRLFTPACYNGLPGMPFPADPNVFPTKDEMADYLEAYATRFALPVRSGVRVDALAREGERLVVRAGARELEADNVVIAMSIWQQARVPAFARDLHPDITQLHAADYRDPSQFRNGPVLVVGAGNSGYEIALDAARGHATLVAGRDTGHIPFRIDGLAARLILRRLVLGFLFHHVLTVRTPLGRRMRGRIEQGGWPLVRLRPADLVAAGVARLPRVAGVQDGRPLLEDGRIVDVANVVWCTGFQAGLSWVRLPAFQDEEPVQERGVVRGEPGVYVVGHPFVYAVSSGMVHGVGRDAAYVARHIAARGPRPAHRGIAGVTIGTGNWAMG
jgi:putative flavoprotein involved in K+ transport